MSYRITIGTDNAAFDEPGELYRILADLAYEARNHGDLSEQALVDANGNTVGRVERTPEEGAA